MKIAVFGTGMVGETIASKLILLGHNVCMASRTANNEKGQLWAATAGPNASHGSFPEAATWAELIFVCTKGDATLGVMQNVPAELVAGKIVVDVSNPLDFSNGFPPSLAIVNTTSLAEEIQRAHPTALVVKTLNIVNCSVMTNPQVLGRPTMFLCGANVAAKQTVVGLLKGFGWEDIVDLGGLDRARGMEMLLPLWLSASQCFDTARFAFQALR